MLLLLLVLGGAGAALATESESALGNGTNDANAANDKQVSALRFMWSILISLVCMQLTGCLPPHLLGPTNV